MTSQSSDCTLQPTFVSSLPLPTLRYRQHYLLLSAPCTALPTPAHGQRRKQRRTHGMSSIRSSLHSPNHAFGDHPHPSNPFSYEQFTESGDIEYDVSGNDRGNDAVHDPHKSNGSTAPTDDHHDPDHRDAEQGINKDEHDTEEMFFDGLSYPTDALDWCSTKLDCGTMTPPSSTAETDGSYVCNAETDLQMRRVEKSFVDTFRMSSPYINSHQGVIFVIHIPGALLKEKMFASVMEDIALMRVVGIKLVLVLGPQGLIHDRLKQENIYSRCIDGMRVTDSKALQIVKELSGSMRFEVECALAKGVTNMPSYKSISVVSGNFYSAQPVGIIDGHDFGYTGKVRKIEVESIKRRLDQGDIILLPNVGSSPSGQQFNCKAEEVAGECAAQLSAEKLIFMGSGETLYDRRSGHTIPNLSLKSAARYLRSRSHLLPNDFRFSLEHSVSALDRGVRRAHILNRFMDGVLLMEVFHRDGIGLMVSRDLYEGFRPAKLKDVNGVKTIIRPLEEQGILKRRSRTMLENDIEKFVVIERDGMIIACLSLSLIEEEPTWAELGCVAVHKDYRKLGKGDAMLGFTERMAYDKGVKNLFVLSTQSFEWFHERGFKEVGIDYLPKSRQEIYDRSRRSKIFYKVLQGSRAVRLTLFSTDVDRIQAQT